MSNKEKFAYTSTSFLRQFFTEHNDRKYSSNELFQIYVGETGKKISKRAFQKAINRLSTSELFTIERNEQLYCIPIPPADEKRTLQANFSINSLNKRTPRIHSAHKILFSLPYKGTQPTTGTLHLFGRYKTAKAYTYKLGKITIRAYKHKLNVWVHRPDGQRTNEQLINARVMGYNALKKFAKNNKLDLQGFLEKVIRSHHVVEARQVNKFLKPVFEKYPKEIEEQIGSKICKTSHKGKVEHEGKQRKDKLIQGEQVAKGLEHLILELPENLDNYNKNIKLHLEVMQEIKEGIAELRDAIKQLHH